MRTLKKAGVLSDRTKFSCLLQGIGIRGYIQNSRSAPRKSTTTLGYLVKPEKRFWSLTRMKASPINSRVNRPKNNDVQHIPLQITVNRIL
jgi:hypothetical protein